MEDSHVPTLGSCVRGVKLRLVTLNSSGAKYAELVMHRSALYSSDRWVNVTRKPVQVGPYYIISLKCTCVHKWGSGMISIAITGRL